MEEFFSIFSSFMNGACTCFFLLTSVWFFHTRRESRLRYVLAYIFLYWFLLMAKDPVYQLPSVQASVYWYDALQIIDMTAVLTCAVYVMELLGSRSVRLSILLWHAVPFALYICVYLLVGAGWLFYFFKLCAAVYCMGVFVYIIFYVRRYNNTVRSLYSDIEPLNIRWLWTVVPLLLCQMAVWFFVSSHISSLYDAGYYFLVMALWGLIAYYSSRQQLPPKEDELQDEELPASDHSDNVVTSNVNSAFFEKEIRILFHEKQIARNPGLTLPEVVKLIGTNRSYFSAYLNNELHMNFYDFVNGYRLRYAEQLLCRPDVNLTQEDLAREVGFNSLSTFRRAFAKQYGMTPAQFRANVLEHNLQKDE